MADNAQSKPMNSGEGGPGRASATDLLAVAAWFGLVTGLLEGISRTVLQSLGGVSWEMLLSAASVKIIWVAPFFYIFLFSLGGAVLALLNGVVPRLPMARAAVFLFGLAGFADVLSSSGRLSQWGVGMLALGLAVVLTRWFKAHEKPALRFWRRSVAWVAVLAVLSFVGIEAGIRLEEQRAIAALPAAAPGTPNVLIIVVDTLREDHLSLYGYSRKTSPNLERLAAQSVLFENAIATSSWTLPSHASMLTGLYPSAHGAEVHPLDKRHVVLPEALRGRGYRTAAFSANTLMFTQAYGFGRGFIRFEDSFQKPHDMFVRTLLGRQLQKRVIRPLGDKDIPSRKRAAEINQALLRWLDQNQGRPFFAFLNYFDVHDPYLPPQPYRGKFSKRPNPGGVFNSFINQVSPSLFTPEVLEDEIAAYDGSIAYVDAQIGQLLAELDRRSLSQDTILIITSDHGESLSEHGLFCHRTSLYGEQLEVPLIIRWPGKIPAGKRVETPVSLASLPATVMSLTGAGERGPFPGPSLVPLWTEANPPADWPYPWAELAACPEDRSSPFLPCFIGALKAIVTPDWYFIYHEKQAPQLFDAKKDRAQLHNLAETPEGQKVVAEFLARVRENHKSMGSSVNNTLPGKR